MEDYGWLVFVAIFWILSTVGEFRKKGRARRREGQDGPERHSSRPDPAASGRELSAEMDDAARQAEDALRRWEARQREFEAAPMAERLPEVTRQRADEQERLAAYEAIAGMLAPEPAETDRAVQPSSTWAAGIARKPDARHAERVEPADGVRPPAPAATAAPAPPGLARLDRLPVMQRAIVLSEILGPPKTLG